MIKDKQEFIGQIIDTVEDFLDEIGIASPDEAYIVGNDYDSLYEKFENLMTDWGVVGSKCFKNRIKKEYTNNSDVVFSEFLRSIYNNKDDSLYEAAHALSEEDIKELLAWSGEDEYVSVEDIIKQERSNPLYAFNSGMGEVRCYDYKGDDYRGINIMFNPKGMDKAYEIDLAAVYAFNDKPDECINIYTWSDVLSENVTTSEIIYNKDVLELVAMVKEEEESCE